jgi:hypothetical protein
MCALLMYRLKKYLIGQQYRNSSIATPYRPSTVTPSSVSEGIAFARPQWDEPWGTIISRGNLREDCPQQDKGYEQRKRELMKNMHE